MSTQSSSPDLALFVISPDQKSKYDAQFNKLSPAGGLITGEQAKGIMLKSGLPPAILAHVWELSKSGKDAKDGRMDVNEFSIALHLIALNLKGVPVPRTLPPPLKLLVEPPLFEAFDNKSARPPLNASNSISPTVSLTRMSGNLNNSNNNSMNNISSHAGGPTAPKALVATGEWPILQNSKLKYTQLFNSHDRQRNGHLTGQQARSILLESKLPQAVLAQIWNLSDVDSNGILTCEEFILAMHLIDKAKNNEILPSKLPPELIPPSFRRTSTSGTVSRTSSVDEPPIDSNELQKHSFEDKRRENFEKGQAELDRRRATLMEQQRREKEERERKEREENARREKERLEAERKKLEELEQHQQRIRETELEKEEVKRRALEVKELARKEMERQRQRELEQVKRNELLAQRARLVDEIHKLKLRKKQLMLEHEKTDKALEEAKTNCAISREKVVRAKSEIDGMRIKRDQTMAKQTQIKAQIKTLTERQLFIEQEKVKLSAHLKSIMAKASNGLGGDQQQLASYASMLQSKQLMISQLKSQLERIKQEIQTKKSDTTIGKTELQQLKQKFNETRKEARSFADLVEQKRIEAERARDSDGLKDDTANEPTIVWGQEVPSNVQWPSANEKQVTEIAAPQTIIQTKFKYKCLYQFEARNKDEITIKPGDIVMVDTSACSEPDWMSGEINGKVGWFPKDYVELIDDGVSSDLIPEASIETTTAHPASYSPAPDSKKAIALYDYSSTEDGHITFIKDDTIRVTQQHDDWYYGENLNSTGNVISSGWFIGSYVKILDGDVLPANDQPSDIQASSSVALPDQYYTSLYQFESIEPGDLSFDVNELVYVEKKDGDWWTGVIVDKSTGQRSNTRKGVFPSNYVEPALPEDIPTNKVEISVSSEVITKEPTIHKPLDRKGSEVSISDSSKPKKSKSKKLEIVTVIAPYTATGAEQLSLEVGQLIQVRKKMTTGWWEGELQAKGKKKQVGWFPATFVKSLTGAGVVNSTGSSARNTPVPESKNPSEEPEIERVMALYPFKATRSEEIDFEQNDVIRVISKPDPTWWRGHNIRTDTVGLFPFNHVQVMQDTTDKSNGNYNFEQDDGGWDQSEFSSDSFDEEIQNGQSQAEQVEWSDNSFESDESDDETENGSIVSNNDHKSISTTNLSPQLFKVQLSDVQANRAITYIEQDQMNKQRLYAIYELIVTEESYVKDLYFTLENFKAPLYKRKLLNKDELQTIFSNLDEIYRINNQFYSEFIQRHESNSDPSEYIICDLILSYLKKMLPSYKVFCSTQVAGSRCLQQKLESDQNFSELLRAIAVEFKSRLPLISYLLKPMQRITKYPLLIEKINEATPHNHVDYDNSLQSLVFAKEFCKEINDACRESENFEKLSWLQKHVNLDMKLVDYSIDFNSETQMLGPRQFLHAGILLKATSSKILAAFLFNDFLMLTLPNKKITNKSSSASNFFYNEKALNSTYKIYRKPLLINDIKIDETIKFENSFDSSIFRLQIKSLKRSIKFRASSSNDCVLWIQKIKKAQHEFEEIMKMQTEHQIKKTFPKKKVAELYLTIVEGVQLYSRNHVLNAYCRVAISSHNSSQWSNCYSNFETKICRTNFASKDRTSSLKRNKSTLQEENICKVTWESNFRFNLSSLSDTIIFSCLDANPFAPHTLLGEAKLNISKLMEDGRDVIGPMCNYNVPLQIPKLELNKNLMVSRTKPSLFIKYHIR